MRLFAVAAAAFVAAWGGARAAPPFAHIILVIQENRTPDNLFGSNPHFEAGVDIASQGTNSLGKTIKLAPVSLAGCYDPDHQHLAFTQMYDGGKMDGADQVQIVLSGQCVAPANPQFVYADNATGDIQPYFDIASSYGFANRMFQTNQGPSFPAHQFLFGGTSAPGENSRLFASENMAANAVAGCVAPPGQRVLVIDPHGLEGNAAPVYPCFHRPTMANLLDAAKLDWTYYLDGDTGGSIWDAPIAIDAICAAKPGAGGRACSGSVYGKHVAPAQGQVLTDITACKLAAVSWVIPNGLDSDHPRGNNGGGPSWVASIVNAVGQQAACPNGETYWRDTAIFITWDDWGGFYDHVRPPGVNGAGGGGWGRGYVYGFRVPLLVVSAYTAAGTVNGTILDFGSLLAFIEQNFKLPHIGPGTYADAYANLPSAFFNLDSPRAFVPVAAPLPPSTFTDPARPAVPPDSD